MAVQASEKLTTAEDVLAFFERSRVDLRSSAGFAPFDAEKLAAVLAEQIRTAFPDAGVQVSSQFTVLAGPSKGSKSADSVRRDLVEIREAPYDAVVLAEILDVESFKALGAEYGKVEETIRALSGSAEFSRHHVILLAEFLESDSDPDELARLIENVREATPYPIRVLAPDESWPVFFDKYEPSAPHDDNKKTDAARLYVLSDDALKGRAGDMLGFVEYAVAFGGLINDEHTTTPLTLAINAKWGVGKTSLARMIEEHLVEGSRELNESPHITYWFNAWMHDDADKLDQAFMTDIVRFANQKRPLWQRILRPLPSELCSEEVYRYRRGWLGAIAVTIALALSYNLVVVTGVDVFELFNLDVKEANLDSSQGTAVVIFVLAFALLRYLGDAFASLSKFLSMHAAPVDTGSLETVRRRLTELIRAATPEGRKFVVFIDDLERCRPTRSIDVLEVVNQLLSFEPVVCVVIADMAALAANAEIKYADLAKRYNPETGEVPVADNGSRNAYGRLFLQKFIQLRFDLPEPSKDSLKAMLASLSHVATQDEHKKAKEKAESTEKIRKSFGEIGLMVARLGPTVFSAWHPPTKIADLFRSFVRGAHWSQRLLAGVLWVPLLPFVALAKLGLRLSGLDQLRPNSDSMAKFGRYVILFSLLLTAYSIGAIFVDPVPELIAWRPFFPEGKVALLQAIELEEGSRLLNELSIVGLYLEHMAVVYLPGLLSGATVLGLASLQRSRRSREKLQQAAKMFANFESGGGNTQLERPADSVLGEHAWQALYLRERQHFLSQDSKLFERAGDYAFEHMLLVPRNAKRLMNRLRLNLFILDQKGAFTDPDTFGGQHLGKWVVLHESWPELATAIVHRPELIGDLEDAAVKAEKEKTRKEKFEKEKPANEKPAMEKAEEDSKAENPLISLLDELRISQSKDPYLHKLLIAEPALKQVIRRLTMFEVDKPTEVA
ncbi:MAG: P-loop NTPase fold protein [Gammaproteobacteria bacterium]|nr:P-loop NTPase fold protein [Gammaproteobacteria bacterium]